MKKEIAAVAVAATALVFCGAASAQTWNGPEIGIQGGFGWGDSSGQVVRPVGPSFPHYRFQPDGGLGGVHAGDNWQSGPYVAGIEADAEGGALSGTHFGPGGSIHSSLDFDASVRGKLGYGFDRFLVYGTGGAAFGDVATTYRNLADSVVASPSEVRVGWTAGAGLDYALTPRWSVGVEYRYTDLGSQDAASAPDGQSDSNHFTDNVVRARLTYRFAPTS